MENQKTNMIRRRNRIRGANARRKKVLIKEYLEALESYKDSIITTRTSAWKKYCTNQERDTMWEQVYKSILATGRHGDILLKDQSGRTLNPSESATLLAETFYPEDDDSADSREQATLRKRTQDYVTALLNRLGPGPVRVRPFQSFELQNVVRKLGRKKAPGLDGFTADICERVIHYTGGLFLAAANKCLELGCFPRVWKVAVIRIVPKPLKDDYSRVKAYRPIGLLPVFGKILEKLFTVRVMWHLGSRGLLSSRQYGFMPQKSTEDALFDAMEIIKKGMDDKKLVAVVSLDIEGAFDGAWWPFIKAQLIAKDCPPDLLLLINSYLSERMVRVQYAGVQIPKTTTKGCIQGSTCGPLMWNIQLDPLLRDAATLEAHIQAFADDILVIATAKTTAELSRKVNCALHRVAEWGRSSNMNFAAHKTQAIIVTRKNKYEDPQFSLNGVNIAISDELKVLGLTIDSRLTFKSHVQATCTKAVGIYRAVATATRANWGLGSEITRLLYTAVVEPIVLYAAGAWGDAVKKKYVDERLNQLTRRFAIMIARAHRTVSHTSVVCLAGILPLDLRVSEVADLYRLKRGQEYPELPGRVVEDRISPFLLPHPADRKPIYHNYLNNQEDVEAIDNDAPKLFTDGSKIEGKVGAAVTWWEKGEEQRNSSFSLAPYCSVYQAELVAISRALDMYRKHRGIRMINIISDSRSALQSIEDPEHVNPIVHDIHKKIAQLEEDHRYTILHWVRAHEGIPGNERADELAKKAALTKKTSYVYDLIPISFLKHSLRQNTIDVWNTRYKAAPTGKITKLFFPEVRKAYSVLREVRMTNLRALIFTGHGGLREYLHRFKLIPNPGCVCNPDTPETLSHVLNYCPRFARHRYDLSFKISKPLSENYYELIADKNDRRAFFEFAEQVVRIAARANGSTAV